MHEYVVHSYHYSHEFSFCCTVDLFVLQKKTNTPEAQQKCITRLLIFHFCVNLPILIVTYPLFKFMGMRSTLPLPSWYFLLLCILSFTCVIAYLLLILQSSFLLFCFLLLYGSLFRINNHFVSLMHCMFRLWLSK